MNLIEPFETLAEWRIRRLQEPKPEPRETYDERVKRWALSSIGLEGIAQDIFLHLQRAKMATMDDLKAHFKMGDEEIQKNLDLLYTAGLIDRIGKAYLVDEAISASIVRRLIPRITETMRTIAKLESDSRSNWDFFRRMNGRAFSDIGAVVAACREMLRRGKSPRVKAIGVQGYGDKSIEVEGPVIECSCDPLHLTVVSSSGDKVIVGGRDESGVDVKAHTVIMESE
jgi:hypothetical protein